MTAAMIVHCNTALACSQACNDNRSQRSATYCQRLIPTLSSASRTFDRTNLRGSGPIFRIQHRNDAPGAA